MLHGKLEPTYLKDRLVRNYRAFLVRVGNLRAVEEDTALRDVDQLKFATVEPRESDTPQAQRHACLSLCVYGGNGGNAVAHLDVLLYMRIEWSSSGS